MIISHEMKENLQSGLIIWLFLVNSVSFFPHFFLWGNLFKVVIVVKSNGYIPVFLTHNFFSIHLILCNKTITECCAWKWLGCSLLMMLTHRGEAFIHTVAKWLELILIFSESWQCLSNSLSKSNRWWCNKLSRVELHTNE